jgi:hypothetical protein
MGYTHYWHREPEISAEVFKQIVADFKKLVPVLQENGVPLAGPFGKGKPKLTASLISFNGPEACGHPKNSSVSIPWPSSQAGGVAPSNQAVDGTWFAGATLESRCCNGDCSYETCYIERVMKPDGWQTPENGKYFSFCKTAFRPYDIAVTALLVVCKKHLGDAFVASSDGEDQHWFDGKMLCQTVLGYGLEFELTRDGGLELATSAVGEA